MCDFAERTTTGPSGNWQLNRFALGFGLETEGCLLNQIAQVKFFDLYGRLFRLQHTDFKQVADHFAGIVGDFGDHFEDLGLLVGDWAAALDHGGEAADLVQWRLEVVGDDVQDAVHFPVEVFEACILGFERVILVQNFLRLVQNAVVFVLQLQIGLLANGIAT